MCNSRAGHQPVTVIRWQALELQVSVPPSAWPIRGAVHLCRRPKLRNRVAGAQPVSQVLPPAKQCAFCLQHLSRACLQASMQLARHHPCCLHNLLCLLVGFLGGITVASVAGIGGLAHFTWHRQLLAVSGLVGRGLLAKLTMCLLILGEASLPIYLVAQHSLRVLQRSIFQDVMQGAKT